MEIEYGVMLLIIVGLYVHIYVQNKQMDKLIVMNNELLDEVELVLKRENYLLKTMNDAMSVSDIAGFMSQRMRNAPKEFQPKTDAEINPDNVRA